MGIYILKRILSMIPVLFIMSVIVFLLIHIIPGDPAKVMLGDQATIVEVEALHQSMGLDDPLPVQYLHWITNVCSGQLGHSLFINESMGHILISHFFPTLQLTLYSLFFAVLLAIPLGLLAANKKGSLIDEGISSFAMLGISVPSFLLGLLLVLALSVKLSLLPSGGYKSIASGGLAANFRYMLLPALTMGLVELGLLVRMTRSSVLDILSQDFIRMLHAKGVKGHVILVKHALKNASLPILTCVGQSFIGLLSNAAIAETIFNIPGLGQLIINSVTRRDYEVIQAVILFVAIANIIVYLCIDIFYMKIDPRVKLR